MYKKASPSAHHIFRKTSRASILYGEAAHTGRTLNIKMASFARKVAVTYGTFVVANWGSNFLLYPDKKLDYGFLNRYLGREVCRPSVKASKESGHPSSHSELHVFRWGPRDLSC